VIKRISLWIGVALIAATIMAVTAMPVFAWEQIGHCNAGNGNGNEYCDPGNSAPVNRGGDEIGCITDEGGSTPNPGGNDVLCI